MHNLNHWRVNLLLVFCILATLLLVCVITVVWRDYSQREKIYLTAEKLGYDPALKIAQVNRCFDVFSHCYLFLYYKTDLTQEELKHKIDTLSWDISNEMEVDGYEIFTDINYGTTSRLTIDGTDELGDRSQLPNFDGYRWRLRDSAGGRWTITYFPLSSHPGSIALDGSKLEHNIVAIQYQTR